jgi:phage tail sheath protein FI
VPELVFSEIDTERLVRLQPAIERVATAVTAFVGRTLKGPVNRATSISSFDEYQRIFGGLWQPSTLSYAIEQYFENGGRSCIVVRVCNGGRAPTLSLPCGPQTLSLLGVSPGTREYLRAAVDYDGIAASETDRFNLVVQRLRAAGTELIEDQEIFQRATLRPGAERSLPQLLSNSELVRVAGTMPTLRPDRTVAPGGASSVGYVASNPDGDDGDTLTNYDIIGDARNGTGLFALRADAMFNFLYVPPLSRQLDVGLPALLVALRLCRARQAMLLVDPPGAWDSPAAAIEGLRNWPFQSEDALMFYPRLLAFDRLRGRYEQFGSAAAGAGLLARSDQVCPVWSVTEADEPMLRPGLRPAVAVTELDRIRLAHFGANTVAVQRPSSRQRGGLLTLLPEVGNKSAWRSLSARRFALFLMSSIERGTRWVQLEHSGAPLWAQVRAQVTAFFDNLVRDGAFLDGVPSESYFVICDERLNNREAMAGGQFQLLFGVAGSRAGDFRTFLVTHRPDSDRARIVSVNRYALPHQD